MRLIPMYFGFAQLSILGLDGCNSFELSPPGLAELPAKSHYIPDLSTGGYGFNTCYLTYYLKIHGSLQ
jgi:hypothetical protein